MTFLYLAAITLFLALCCLLCFVILIQESKSSGFGSSFGGDSSESLFGTATADILKKFTGYLAAIFLISCIFLSFWTQAMGRVKSSPSNPVEEIEEK